jgi:hypothetical protein
MSTCIIISMTLEKPKRSTFGKDGVHSYYRITSKLYICFPCTSFTNVFPVPESVNLGLWVHFTLAALTASFYTVMYICKWVTAKSPRHVSHILSVRTVYLCAKSMMLPLMHFNFSTLCCVHSPWCLVQILYCLNCRVWYFNAHLYLLK